MRRVAAWLLQFDWRALVGSALFFIFYIGVISPIISHAPSPVTEQQIQQTYSTADQAAIEKYLTSESFWQRTSHDPVAFYTFIMALFTCVLSVSTIGLWYVTWRTLRHAEVDAKRETHQMRVSNQAAIRAANAAVASQRPWLNINVEPISPMVFGDDGPKITLAFHITNMGNTPATHVQFWAYMLPESTEQKTTSVELAMRLADAFSAKLAEVEFGLLVFPGSAPRQEQTHVVPTEFFKTLITDWDKRPAIGLIIAIVMTYRFVGGAGRTQCAFRIQPRYPLRETEYRITTNGGPIAADKLTCERETLWDQGN